MRILFAYGSSQKWRLSSSMNSFESRSRAIACHTAQAVFSRLFLKTLFNFWRHFFFLTSRCSGALPIPLTPSSLAFLSSPNASHFSAGFLLGCLTNCPLCGRGERRAQPKRFSAFNLSYSASCWDLLLTLNKSLSHAWCGLTSFSAAQLAAKRLRELCLNVWCDTDTTRKIRPYEEGNSVCGCIRILWVTDNLVYCKMEVMLSLSKL